MENNLEVIKASSAEELFEMLNNESTPQAVEPVTVEQLFEEEPIVETAPPQTTEEPPVVEPSKSNAFYERAQFLIEQGFWDDYEIVTTNEQGEEVSVPISEIKDLDEDLFEQIKDAQKEKKEEQIKEKYISVEGIDETTKKIIDLKRKGGDITEVLEVHKQYVSPLEQVDITNEAHQEWLIRQKLALNPDLDQDDIDNKVKKLKANLILDKEAEKVYTEFKTRYDEFLQQKLDEQEKLIQAQKEEQKQFRKSITEAVKNLDLKNENVIRKIVDVASKVDEVGLTEADKKFFEIKQSNPEKFAKIALLLEDEELFNKIYGSKVALQTKVEGTKKILNLRPRTASQEPQKSKPSSKEEEIFNQI